jgi:hypothetical protein
MGGILWLIIAALLAIWAVGLALKLFGALIHIVLVVAAALFLYNLFVNARRRL